MQQLWEDYYQRTPYFNLEPHDSLAGFVEVLDARNINQVLDLGCGPGIDIAYLAAKGFEVEGVDFSPAAVANAEDLLQSKNLPGKVYVDNLFDKISTFEASSWPAVMAINSLEYTDYAGFKDALRGVVRLIKPKGVFLLVVSSEHSQLQQKMPVQLYFNEQDLLALVKQQFTVLDLDWDAQDNYVLILERNGNTWNGD